MTSAGPWRFDDDPRAVRTARSLVAETLTGWGLTELLDDAAVVASELLTNACRHGAAPIALALFRTDGGVALEVSDGSPVLPVWQDPGEYGRFGMWVIESLAQVTVQAGPAGKTIRAELPLIKVVA